MGDALLQHRIKKAHAAFALLRPWWRSSPLSKACKLKLYKMTVLPVLLYGVGASGSSDKGENKFKKVVSKQLRAIFRCPVHLSRESDSDLFRRLGLLPPAVYIHVACCQLARQLLPEVNGAAYVGTSGINTILQVHLDTRSSWARCIIQGLKLLYPKKPDLSWEDLSSAALRSMLAGIEVKMLKTDYLVELCWLPGF